MKEAKAEVSAPEITPSEGIVAIRRIVGSWLHANGTKPRDAIASVANVLLSVSVPVFVAPLTERQQVAKQCVDTMMEIERRTLEAANVTPQAFTGLTPAKKVDLITHLENMIEQACHKPGEWKESPFAGGEIEGCTWTESYDLAIGKLLQRRDAFLAIDAVNALPELIKRVRDAEKGERSADAKVDELTNRLEESVAAHNALIDATHAERDTAKVPASMPDAWDDVLKERARQTLVEWHTPERDDCYTSGELAQAAAAYALHGVTRKGKESVPYEGAKLFPWDPEHWKPTNRRRDLVKAAALLLADIERIDRSGETATGIL